MAPNPKSTNRLPPGSLVCVIDDDESVCRSLTRLLRSAQVPAEPFSSAAAFLERETHAGPSCLVLDVRMPGINGLELQKTLAAREAQIVFLTGHADVPMCAEAMKAGAVDFLTKPVEDEDLLAAVGRALARSAEIRQRLVECAATRARINTLTPREFEVMRRVIAGMLNKQIAADLNSAVKTIKVHRGRVMEKMGVRSVADLVRAAQAVRVMPVPPSLLSTA